MFCEEILKKGNFPYCFLNLFFSLSKLLFLRLSIIKYTLPFIGTMAMKGNRFNYNEYALNFLLLF